MSVLSSSWLWVLVAAVVVLIVALFIFDARGRTQASGWLIAIFVSGIVLLLISAILFCYSMNQAKTTQTESKSCTPIQECVFDEPAIPTTIREQPVVNNVFFALPTGSWRLVPDNTEPLCPTIQSIAAQSDLPRAISPQ